jgi:hypothetical protein
MTHFLATIREDLHALKAELKALLEGSMGGVVEDAVDEDTETFAPKLLAYQNRLGLRQLVA